jgi:hypothetical protein
MKPDPETCELNSRQRSADAAFLAALRALHPPFDVVVLGRKAA